MKPSNKVFAGALAGALAAIIAWAAKTFGHVDMPPEIAVAVSTVLTFVTQYVVPDSTGSGDADQS